MKIPDSLKIIGQTVKVTQHRFIDKKAPGKIGLATYSANKIELSKRCHGSVVDRQYMACTLLHEVIHHIDDKMNIGLKEKQVDRLATGLYQVMVDNKLRFY